MNEKIILPFLFGFLGILFSSKTWILFMDKLNPVQGLIIYYIILIITILLLEYFGLVIAGVRFLSVNQAIGTILIVFSFFILVNWTSCYISYVTKGNCDNISNIYAQSEDGAVYYLWSKLTDDPAVSRWLTYVLTPMVLSFIGMNLITNKIVLTPF